MNHFIDYIKLTILKAFRINAGNKIKLAGYTVHFGTISHLKLLFKEIFVKENYLCEVSEEPYIIDGGANIGLAVLYFKKKYPNSRIVAFEPNEDSFEYLKKNVVENKLENVTIFNSALSDKDGTLTFYTSSDMPSADIGASAVKNHVDHHHSEKGEIRSVSVECKALSPFIDRKVDLLKIDIEGSEGSVFKEIKDRYNLVENCIMEYHYQIDNKENLLSEILETIEQNQHLYHIGVISKSLELKKVNAYIITTKKFNPES